VEWFVFYIRGFMNSLPFQYLIEVLRCPVRIADGQTDTQCLPVLDRNFV
jgi:hypothetical protein